MAHARIKAIDYYFELGHRLIGIQRDRNGSDDDPKEKRHRVIVWPHLECETVFFGSVSIVFMS